MIVYILSNEAMPGLIKIGLTQNLAARIKQLYTTGVPLPFTCEYAARVEDATRVENALHKAFSDKRLHDRREFFELEVFQARVILELLAIEEVSLGGADEDITVEEVKAVERRSERRKRFNFAMVDVPMEAELHFHNDEATGATVVDRTKVNFRGEVMSLSAAAAIKLQEDGFAWAARSCAGPQYWTYDGETLQARRLRMEEED